MNDREFDAFLREAMRAPSPSHVPIDVRADEIERVVAAVFDELAWGDDAGGLDAGLDDDRRDDGDAQRTGLHAWDDAETTDVWGTDDDDPLPSSNPLEPDDRHPPDPLDTGHGDTGHGDTGQHDLGHPGTDDHGPFGHHHEPPDHGLDES